MLRVMPTSVSKCRRTFRKLLISVFASFFLNANIVCADTRTFNYEVRWQFVTVGTIELNLIRSPEKNSISLSAKTKGPFKFLRAKEADVISTIYRTGERTYEFKSVGVQIWPIFTFFNLGIYRELEKCYCFFEEISVSSVDP